MTFVKNKLFWILALAFVVRAAGIQFGLPHLYHQDEMIVVNHAMAIGVDGWNPHFFVLPPFSIYFLFIVYGVMFAAGKISGVYPSAEAFATQFLSDPSVFYLAGRFFLGVVFGVGAVFVVFKICKRLMGEDGAFLASLFLAAAYLPAAHGHYIYADGPLVFFQLCALYAFIRFLTEGGMKPLLLFSCFTALAVASKYTAAYFLPAYILVYVIFGSGTASQKCKAVCLTAMTSAAVFALAAPYTFLDWTSFWTQMRTQTGAQGPVGYAHHLNYSLANGLGSPAIFLAAIGCSVMLRTQRVFGWLLLLQIAVYYGVNIYFTQPFARYMLPLVPLACILAAYACEKIPSVLLKRVLIGAVVLSNLAPVLYLNALFFRSDTRDQAAVWFEKNAPQGSVIVRDNRFFAPQIIQTPEQLAQNAASAGSAVQRKRWEMQAKAVEKEKSFSIYTLRSPGETAEGAFLSEKPYVNMDLGELKKIGARYLVVNHSTQPDGGDAFLASHASQFELAASFSPFKSAALKNPLDPYSLTAAPDSLRDLFSRKALGPYLEVYRIKDA